MFSGNTISQASNKCDKSYYKSFNTENHTNYSIENLVTELKGEVLSTLHDLIELKLRGDQICC